MRPTFGRRSVAERGVLTLERRGGGLAFGAMVLGGFALGGCSPVQAEVGSDPPNILDSGAIVDGSNGTDGGLARCDALAPLRLYQRNLHPAASSPDVNFIFKVENATGSALSMSSLKARYYFTNELAPPTTIDVFYTDTCCSNKMTGFNDAIVTTLATGVARPLADAYLEVAFGRTAGTLASGDAVQVEIAFHDVGYVHTLVQTNDYSFAANAVGTQAAWDECPGPQCDGRFTTCSMTLLSNDVLVWGTPP